jgi:hypothetical protein
MLPWASAFLFKHSLLQILPTELSIYRTFIYATAQQQQQQRVTQTLPTQALPELNFNYSKIAIERNTIHPYICVTAQQQEEAQQRQCAPYMSWPTMIQPTTAHAYTIQLSNRSRPSNPSAHPNMSWPTVIQPTTANAIALQLSNRSRPRNPSAHPSMNWPKMIRLTTAHAYALQPSNRSSSSWCHRPSLLPKASQAPQGSPTLPTTEDHQMDQRQEREVGER